ncbi:MAG TPA: glycoside hydrolase family 5 protein [Marinagarivorans sp.]
MRTLTSLKQRLLTSLAAVLITPSAALAGFSVSGTQLFDDNGQRFVMRGINHAHTWFTHQTATAIPNIAATGANTIRVVLSNGQTWTHNSASEIDSIIQQCYANQVICVLEVHDVTGAGDTGGNSSNTGTIAGAAQYWVDMADTLKGHENYIIINIANEPTGNGVPASEWIGQHQAAIRAIRGAGLSHTLMVDAANWGQDWEEIMLNNASDVASADALSNTLFSVHMYQVYQSYDKVRDYITTFQENHSLPLVVGEFGDNHQGEAVDADSIMALAEELGVGYLGWSWSGNGECCLELDIVNNWNPNSLSPWGERLINGANGIKETAQKASIFSDAPPVSRSSQSAASSIASSPASSAGASNSSTNDNTGSAGNSSSAAGGVALGSLGHLSSLVLFGLLFLRRKG